MTTQATKGGWTKVPNAILDAMPNMGGLELKLTTVLVRQTFGWRRNQVRMTWDDMLELTSIKGRTSISKAIDEVEKRGFFARGRKSLWVINSSFFELFPENDSSDYELRGMGVSSENEPKSIDDSSENEPTDHLYLNKESKEKEKERNAPAPKIEFDDYWDLPPELSGSEVFVQKWRDWLVHTEQAKITFTPRQAIINLQRFREWGVEKAITALEQAILKGWKNIYEPDIPNGPLKNGPTNGHNKTAWTEGTIVESMGERFRIGEGGKMERIET